jgi:signal peptidase I
MPNKKSRSAQSRIQARMQTDKSRKQGATAPPSGSSRKGTAAGPVSPDAFREIVESIVIAFVLAFLFRTFEAEAFVIPTGSMAPTLMGRHKDLACEKCGYPYRVSASDEVDSNTNQLNGTRVIGCICPMCRYAMDIDDDNPQGKTYRSYKGDRILVSKFPFQFRDPERWEVSVFKYPGGAKTNFIKRIVGLPNETLRIHHGDIFTRKEGQGGFAIERKRPDKLKAMLQTVYDNDYVLGDLIELGWPARWALLPQAVQAAAGDWRSQDHRSFETDGSGAAETWLAYRHFVPSYEDWKFFEAGQLPPGTAERNPQLITDFCPYNTDIPRTSHGYGHSFDDYFSPFGEDLIATKLGLHWVGDLALECELKVVGNSGLALFDLIEGGRHFSCAIDAATGKAQLSISGQEAFGTPTAETAVDGPGSYRVMFANVDDELRLWINGRVVEFDRPTSFDPLGNTRPTEEDLAPARIGSRGAAIAVDHLKIYRDIYYIAKKLGYSGRFGPITDFDPGRSPYDNRYRRQNVASVLSNPHDWDMFAEASPVEFRLEADQFLALGDNSAESKDSRLWAAEGYEYYVSRELLIGKALVIYWPHSLDRIPGTNIPIRFFPNFWRMWFVK